MKLSNIILKTVTIVLFLIVLYMLVYISNNNIKQKNWFITFGGPSSNYHDAVDRITDEVYKIGVFDHIVGYTDLDLKNDKLFWDKHKEFCENTGGFGCWIWKPYLILKTLNYMDDNDVLLYLDAGCTIKLDGEYTKENQKEDMEKLIQKCSQKELLFTSTYCFEKNYSKIDLIKYLNMNRPDILDSIQYQAGILLIKKTKKTVELIKQWYEIMEIYHLSNSDASIYNNEEPYFIASRNDQSVFSLLVKKTGYTEDNLLEEHLPILISRRRGG